MEKVKINKFTNFIGLFQSIRFQNNYPNHDITIFFILIIVNSNSSHLNDSEFQSNNYTGTQIRMHDFNNSISKAPFRAFQKRAKPFLCTFDYYILYEFD